MSRRPAAVLGLGRALPVLLPVLLLAAMPAAAPAAERAGAAGPFADLDAIDVRLEIGGPLDLGGSEAPQLLVGDVARFNRFESNLEQGVGARLESCGILWDQGAVDEVVITIYGRRENLSQAPPHYVYLVEAEVLNSKLASREATPEPVALGSVLGLADEAGLERALIDTAIGLVAGGLRRCDG